MLTTYYGQRATAISASASQTRPNSISVAWLGSLIQAEEGLGLQPRKTEVTKKMLRLAVHFLHETPLLIVGRPGWQVE